MFAYPPSVATLERPKYTAARGYFAFPNPTIHSDPPPPAKPPSSQPSQPYSSSKEPQESPYYKEWVEKNREARLKREERERVARLEGEYEWVKSGGVLRDAEGRRDWARTNRIREEVEAERVRLAEEKRVLAQWSGYEQRWAGLVSPAPASGSHGVHFADVPWPVENGPPMSTGDITPEAIETFIFASLEVRGNRVTRKERIRASILRWHPDKIAAILARVVEEDVRSVREGIGIVMTTLKELQDAEKAAAFS